MTTDSKPDESVTIIESTDFERDPSKLYAGDLRAMGLYILPTIPDCAHVNRDAVRFGEPEIETDDDDIENGTITTGIPVSFSEPFEWVTVTLGLKNNESP